MKDRNLKIKVNKGHFHKIFLLISVLFTFQSLNAQQLKLKARKADAMTGTAFANSIADSSISLAQREKIIFKEIKSGNIPDFLRHLRPVTDTVKNGDQLMMVTYFVVPDYFAIGNNEDFFYVPMTPILAQKVADLTKCSLPTRKMVDKIYLKATIKLAPQPIPPTPQMITVPVFIAHSELVKSQLKPYLAQYHNGEITAGNKKDVVISNKIYGEQNPRVVIYGWHQLNGKPIQPLYHKHVNTWADYSHGIRLIQQKIIITDLLRNKHKTVKIKKILKDPVQSALLSDEGIIEKAYYPIQKTY